MNECFRRLSSNVKMACSALRGERQPSGNEAWWERYDLEPKQKQALVNLVDLAVEVNELVHDRTNLRGIPNNPRSTTAASLFQSAADIADAMVVLVKAQAPHVVQSLGRPLLESYLRGAWVLECASDQSVSDLVNHGRNTRGIRVLSQRLIKAGSFDAPWIRNWSDSDVVRSLNDFSHVGVSAAGQRKTGHAVEPVFPPEVVELLELGVEVRLRAGRNLLRIMADDDNVAVMEDLISSWQVGPPTHLRAAPAAGQGKAGDSDPIAGRPARGSCPVDLATTEASVDTDPGLGTLGRVD